MTKSYLICMGGILSVFAPLNLYALPQCTEIGAHYDTNGKGTEGYLDCVDADICIGADGQTYNCVCDNNANCGYNYYCDSLSGGLCKSCEGINDKSLCPGVCASNQSTCEKWENLRDGYEVKTGTCALNGECDKRIPEFRCAASFFGTAQVTCYDVHLTPSQQRECLKAEGCMSCPLSDGAVVTSVAGENKSIFDCCATDAVFSDPTGSGKYVGKCCHN